MSSVYKSAFTDLNGTVSFGGGGGGGGGGSDRQERRNNFHRNRNANQAAQRQRNRDVRDHIVSNVVQGTSAGVSLGTGGLDAGVSVNTNCTSCHHPRDPFAQ